MMFGLVLSSGEGEQGFEMTSAGRDWLGYP